MTQTITEFNKYLIDNQQQIDIINYVKEINKLSLNIDLSFIDEFIELVNKNECCIHHNMLQKYDLISLKSGTANIKRLFEQFDFKEDDDFTVHNVVYRNKGRGSVTKIEYYLHPRAFKICLMRSLKTKQYAKYYLLLEEAIKYYNDYQTSLKNKYIIRLKSKIVEKDDKIDELMKMLKESEKRAEKRSKKLEQKLDDTNIKLDITNEELSETKNELNYIGKKLNIAVEDRVPKTDNIDKLEDFILLKNRRKNPNFKYYAIRGQTGYVNRKSSIKIIEDKYKEIIRINSIANAVNLWNRLKEKLKKSVEYCGNEMNLISINENEFIEIIKDIYEKRKLVLLDYTSNNNISESDSE
jgi:hypothetical protein